VAPDPRKIAVNVLNELQKGQSTLNRIFEKKVDTNDLLSRDRALLNALVYGVLRWQGRLDFIISHFSTTRLNEIDAKILNILRLGLFQIIYMNRIPNSAAVDTSVKLAKSVAAPWVAGFVNAILRNASRRLNCVPFPNEQKDPVYALAIEKSYPAWLAKRWVDRFGFKEAEALCDATNSIPPICLRTNTLKTTRGELMQSLEAQVEQMEPTVYAPDGISINYPQNPIAHMDVFKKGWFQVQDEAAQLVTLLLDPRPDEDILDACAGLGGKTGHIAQQMNNHGTLIAMDNSVDKLSRLETQMDLLGVSIVSTIHQDLNDSSKTQSFKYFDRILLDAPCTGLGVLRRNPDTKWNASKKNLKRFGDRQVKLIESLASLLKVSGVLVYAVCSVEPEENEAVIKKFMKQNPGYALDQDPGKLPQSFCSRIENKPLIKTYPYFKNMDGFFMARLKRID
jgi:16S rRNA (cytosine967-C5)-methyltransferase